MRNAFLTAIYMLCAVSIWGCASTSGEVDSVKSQETTLESTTEPERLKIVENSGEYKKSCTAFDYEEYYRYEQKYKGSRVILTMQVAQIMDSGFRGYDVYDQEYYIEDGRPEDSVRLMADDIIEVYGEYSGMTKMTRGINNVDEELFSITAEYIDLNQNVDSLADYWNLSSSEVAVEPVVEPEPVLPVEESPTQRVQWDYIFLNSDTKLLSDAELEAVTPEDLRIGKNEIYARHGRRFSSGDLQAWFDSKSWYVGSIEADAFDEGVLNQNEKDNVKKIVSFQEKKGKFEAGWIFGSYECHTESMDTSLSIGWYSGTGELYIRLVGATTDGSSCAEAVGVIIQTDSNQYYYSDSQGSIVLEYNGQDEMKLESSGSFGDLYFPGFDGVYKKTEDLSHYVS